VTALQEIDAASRTSASPSPAPSTLSWIA